MPGYGTLAGGEGSGLLPWSWAEARLVASHDYWVATVWPDGRPHVSPVWGVWMDGALWWSSGRRSRKARNLDADPRCSVTTDRASEPVVLEGRAERITDIEGIAAFVAAGNDKYGGSYSMEFLAPDVNGTYRLRPERAIGLVEADFTGSPTRWTF